MKKTIVKPYETYEHHGIDYQAIPNPTGKCDGCAFDVGARGTECSAPDGLDCKGIKFIEQPKFDNSDYEFLTTGGCVKTFLISMAICIAFWAFVIWAISTVWNQII